MKFVVTQDYNNVVEVKLHWQSKDKIKKFLYWTTIAASTAVAVIYIVDENSKKNEED